MHYFKQLVSSKEAINIKNYAFRKHTMHHESGMQNKEGKEQKPMNTLDLKIIRYGI